MKIKNKILKQSLAVILAAVLLFQPFIGLRVLAEGEVTEPTLTPEPTVVAENTQTGDNSTNQAAAENTQPTTVNNENNSTIENNVDTTANTGNNNVVPEPTPTLPAQEEGLTSQSEGGELSPTPTPEPIIDPLELTGEENQGDGSGENSATGEDLSLPEDGLVAGNEGTGENSENLAAASEGQTTTVVNDNQAAITNDICSSAETGQNTVTGEDSKIDTGDASAETNAVNVVNTNMVGEDFWQAVINLFGTTENDIDLTQVEGFANFDPTLISILSTNANTGDGSVNIALANFLSSFAVYNINTATLINQINLLASTGNNQILGEDGTIDSGNASASLNLFNLVNTNLVGEDWFFGLINLFGDLNGDIILPYELQYLGEEGVGSNGQVSALNQNTGDGSTNQALASETTLVDIDNTNNACLTNNILVSANSGNNEIIGNGDIETGDAVASANLANIVNTNIFGSRWLLLIINNFGNWSGNLVGWWGNLFSVGGTTFAWIRLPDAQGNLANGVAGENLNTGENSENAALASGTNSLLVDNNNTADIQNQINVTADTGNNQIEGEDGTITTGNAQASSNVLNMVNTNIIGNQWFFGVINIFGNFLGDIIFPRPDLAIGKSANKSSVTQGEEIIYTIAYQNIGRLWANETMITDYLPAGESFVACSDGGVYDGGRVIWNLGKILAGQGGSLTVSVRVNTDSGTVLTNTVGIATSTNEPKQDNNFALATSSVSQGGSSGSSSSGGSGGSSSSSSSDGSSSSSTSDGTSALTADSSSGVGGGTGYGFYPETLGAEEVLAATEEESLPGISSANLPKPESILFYVLLLLSSSTYIFFWAKPRLGRG